MIDLNGTSFDIRRATELRADALEWLVLAAREIRMLEGLRIDVRRAAYEALDDAEHTICNTSSARTWIAAGSWSPDTPGDVLSVDTLSALRGEPTRRFDQDVWSRVPEVHKDRHLLDPSPTSPIDVENVHEILNISKKAYADYFGVSYATIMRWFKSGTPKGPASALIRLIKATF